MNHIQRESLDDGVFTGLLLGPIIATALLICALRMLHGSPSPENWLPEGWKVEPRIELHNSPEAPTTLQALVLARQNLVNLSTLCSTILLVHVCSSWWLESRNRKGEDLPEGERASVPRSESQRCYVYITFMLSVSLGTFGAKMLFDWQGYPLWQRRF